LLLFLECTYSKKKWISFVNVLENCGLNQALSTFKIKGEVTSLSERSQGEVEDNRKKLGDLWMGSVNGG